MALPEEDRPAECYYDEEESAKYTRCSRNTKVQRAMTESALRLLAPASGPILDLGCGSGLSSRVVEESGYACIGLDIAPRMLDIASEATESAMLVCSDMGRPLPFADDSVPYAVSISALQWLFSSFEKKHDPAARLRVFFKELYRVVTCRAVVQCYCNEKQQLALQQAARRAGFFWSRMEEGPSPKDRKVFYILDKRRPRRQDGDTNSTRKDNKQDVRRGTRQDDRRGTGGKSRAHVE